MLIDETMDILRKYDKNLYDYLSNKRFLIGSTAISYAQYLKNKYKKLEENTR